MKNNFLRVHRRYSEIPIVVNFDYVVKITRDDNGKAILWFDDDSKLSLQEAFIDMNIAVDVKSVVESRINDY